MSKEPNLDDRKPVPGRAGRPQLPTWYLLACLGFMFLGVLLVEVGLSRRGAAVQATARTTIVLPAPLQVVTPVRSEPEKSTAQLHIQLYGQLAEKQYDQAGDTLGELLDRINPRSLAGAALLLEQGDARFNDESVSQAAEAYRKALLALETHYGALSPLVLPALRGLTASSEEGSDYEVGLDLARRYNRIASAAPVESFDSSGAEADAARYIAEAEQNAATNKDDCLCKELENEIEKAKQHFGPRSYVVALLWLKRAELDDREPAAETTETPAASDAQAPEASDAQAPEENKDASDEDTTVVDEEHLQVVLAILEAHVGPVDARLEPVLRRLIAVNDGEGEHEAADRLVERLSLLHSGKAETVPTSVNSGITKATVPTQHSPTPR